MKNFDEWNLVKKNVENQKYPFFKEREIFYTRIGENVGFEQNGKGLKFVRPVLVFKKFNQYVFWGIPLSRTKKKGMYYFEFVFLKKQKSIALLSQLKLFDAKRLGRKIGNISKIDFITLIKNVEEIFPTVF